MAVFTVAAFGQTISNQPRWARTFGVVIPEDGLPAAEPRERIANVATYSARRTSPLAQMEAAVVGSAVSLHGSDRLTEEGNDSLGCDIGRGRFALSRRHRLVG